MPSSEESHENEYEPEALVLQVSEHRSHPEIIAATTESATTHAIVIGLFTMSFLQVYRVIIAKRHYAEQSRSQIDAPNIPHFPSLRRRHGNVVWFADGRTRMTGERTPRGNIDSYDNDKRDQKANHSRSQVLRPRHPSGNPFNCTKRRNEEKKNRKQHGFCAINGNPHNDNIPPQLPSEPRRHQNRKHQDKQKDRGMSKPPNSLLGN